MIKIARVMVVLLVGCSEVAGPAGPQGPAGAPADPALVAALAMRVAELEGRLEAVRAVKVPHLVHAETGEDFGPMLDWQTVWSEEIGAPVVVVSAGVIYADRDCKGEARISWTSPRLVTIPDGAIVRPIAPAAPFVSASRLDAEIGCRNLAGTDSAMAFDRTGASLAPARPEKVAASLR